MIWDSNGNYDAVYSLWFLSLCLCLNMLFYSVFFVLYNTKSKRLKSFTIMSREILNNLVPYVSVISSRNLESCLTGKCSLQCVSTKIQRFRPDLNYLREISLKFYNKSFKIKVLTIFQNICWYRIETPYYSITLNRCIFKIIL